MKVRIGFVGDLTGCAVARLLFTLKGEKRLFIIWRQDDTPRNVVYVVTLLVG